jgi:hypothetical protein
MKKILIFGIFAVVLSAEEINKYKILDILQTGAGKKVAATNTSKGTTKINNDTNTTQDYQKKNKSYIVMPTGTLPALPSSSQELADKFEKGKVTNGMFTKVVASKTGGKAGSYAKEIDY